MEMPPFQQPTNEKLAPVQVSIALSEFFRYVDHDQLSAEAVRRPEDSGRFAVPENGFPLVTGKRGQLVTIAGEPGPRQGSALTIIVGDEKDFRNSPTSGEELWRPHSGCIFSLGGIAWTKYVKSLGSEVEGVLRPERWKRWYAAQSVQDPSKLMDYADFVGAHLSVLFASLKYPTGTRNDCDCRPQAEAAIQTVVENGGGFFDLADQEARGHGLNAKLAIYALQALGYESDEACEKLGLEYDVRDFSHCAQALLNWTVEYGRDLTEITLMTNNPRKHEAFRTHGITTHKRKHVHGVTAANMDYLRMKTRHGHEFSENDLTLNGQETS